MDFIGLKDIYSEPDLEGAILQELEGFILEFGSGFVTRQKRLVIDRKDFYHRKLRNLVNTQSMQGMMHSKNFPVIA
ncbi:PDDEXK nuclease domain-containing protein [Tautonia rosea]|uniref:PDDEXK nuclease domain-containing protein n=1 Tax=Tautonia rosea TaxID=2728037 RepID=UPI0021BC8C7F|nr:PDDEXK nuclease domain-containing protein [Tautonia rosea]